MSARRWHSTKKDCAGSLVSSRRTKTDEDRIECHPLLRVREDAGVLAGGARLGSAKSGEGRMGVLCDAQAKGSNISLQKVPERRSGKRSRLHLDFYTNDQEREGERLLNLGEKRYPWRYRREQDFVVLEDPDGNLFCVVQISTPK